jgi:hypothetical protein
MMDAATDLRPAPADSFLAGLQAGMLGALWMLLWMGLTAALLRRGFWIPENSMASVFHPQGDIAMEFGTATVSGLALYLLLYSLAGGGFALLAGRRGIRPARATLLGLVFALALYYGCFHLLWSSVAPAMVLLNPVRAAVIGHVIYGIALGRFPVHYPRYEKPVTEIVTEPETKITAP